MLGLGVPLPSNDPALSVLLINGPSLPPLFILAGATGRLRSWSKLPPSDDRGRCPGATAGSSGDDRALNSSDERRPSIDELSDELERGRVGEIESAVSSAIAASGDGLSAPLNRGVSGGLFRSGDLPSNRPPMCAA